MSNETRLQQGVEALALSLSEFQLQQMEDYLQLLSKWNQTYNLTAVRDSDRMISYHLLDSLSIVPHLSQVRRLLDVGSGGGMPGIPVAIARPEIQVVLIDSNHKKTAFLRQAILELKLPNVEVITSRVEHYHPDQLFDGIVSRAFADLDEFVHLTGKLISVDGIWLAMKGVYPYEEIDQITNLVKAVEVIALQVPGLEAERHLVKMTCI